MAKEKIEESARPCTCPEGGKGFCGGKSREGGLGMKGEKAAARFLERRGLDIIERNWECAAGEVDIIARDEDTLCFVEVKTRSSCEKGFPSEAVDARKRHRYERIAACYLQTCEETDIAVRFDIISIIVTGKDRAFLRFHRNAFGCSD